MIMMMMMMMMTMILGAFSDTSRHKHHSIFLGTP